MKLARVFIVFIFLFMCYYAYSSGYLNIKEEFIQNTPSHVKSDNIHNQEENEFVFNPSMMENYALNTLEKISG